MSLGGTGVADKLPCFDAGVGVAVAASGPDLRFSFECLGVACFALDWLRDRAVPL